MMNVVAESAAAPKAPFQVSSHVNRVRPGRPELVSDRTGGNLIHLRRPFWQQYITKQSHSLQ